MKIVKIDIDRIPGAWYSMREDRGGTTAPQGRRKGEEMRPWNVKQETREEHRKAHKCEQCGREMGFEWILGPVCGRCCRVNHKYVVGR